MPDPTLFTVPLTRDNLIDAHLLQPGDLARYVLQDLLPYMPLDQEIARRMVLDAFCDLREAQRAGDLTGYRIAYGRLTDLGKPWGRTP